MPCIPLIGGPHDGGLVDMRELKAEIALPVLAKHGCPPAIAFDQFPIRGTQHKYRLSACHKRYLHESMVGEG